MMKAQLKVFLTCTMGALCFAACNSNDNNNPTNPATPPQQQQQQQGSLFQKYGGTPTIQKVVDDVGTALLADCTQNPYFSTTIGKPGHDSMDRLKSCLDLQFTAVFGGPATYPGPAPSREDPTQTYNCDDMSTIHSGLGIPPTVFAQFIVDVAGVLKADGVSDEDIASVAPTFVGLQNQVVAPTHQQIIYHYTPSDPAGNGCTQTPSI